MAAPPAREERCECWEWHWHSWRGPGAACRGRLLVGADGAAPRVAGRGAPQLQRAPRAALQRSFPWGGSCSLAAALAIPMMTCKRTDSRPCLSLHRTARSCAPERRSRRGRSSRTSLRGRSAWRPSHRPSAPLAAAAAPAAAQVCTSAASRPCCALQRRRLMEALLPSWLPQAALPRTGVLGGAR